MPYDYDTGLSHITNFQQSYWYRVENATLILGRGTKPLYWIHTDCNQLWWCSLHTKRHSRLYHNELINQLSQVYSECLIIYRAMIIILNICYIRKIFFFHFMKNSVLNQIVLYDEIQVISERWGTFSSDCRTNTVDLRLWNKYINSVPNILLCQMHYGTVTRSQLEPACFLLHWSRK